MAEEFLQGGVCGGIWWNSPPNLFSSSPCSFDIGTNFGWSSNYLITDMENGRFSDDSVSDGSSHQFWNQDFLLDSGRSDENYSDLLLDSSMNYRPQINKSFSEDVKSISSSAGFPMSSESYSLLQTLFDTDSEPEQSLSDNLDSFSAANTHQQVMNSNGVLPSLPTAAASGNVPSTFLPSLQSQSISSSLSSNLKSDIQSISTKHEEVTEVKKLSHGPAFKRPRIETPSPLPTFKVRKEKLGDRITALQQLVSPFGKTDTASVLHEAVENIKFLHDQVNALSTPYLKHSSLPLLQRQQGADKAKDGQILRNDLKARGLCLLPISSIFPVASETASDFWTPTFGGR